MASEINFRQILRVEEGVRKIFKMIPILKIMNINLRTIDITQEAFKVNGKPVVIRAVGEYSPDLETYTLSEYLRVGEREILRGQAVIQDAGRLYLDEGVNIENLAREKLGESIREVNILQQIDSLL